MLYLQAMFAQQTSFLDVKRIKADIELQPAERSVEGEFTVEFKLLEDTDSVYLDARNMFFEPIGDAPIDYEGRVDKIVFKGPFTAGQEVIRQFRFRAKPKQTLYFFGSQIWSQGQGKYTSHWLPSLDDMNDKIEFDLSFRIPDPDNRLTIVSNGRLVSRVREDGQLFQEFDMLRPMSSYLVAVAVGAFVQESLVASDSTQIRLYMPAKLESRMEPTYRHTKAIFDFLTSEIGVAYPWQDYKQVPVRDFLYAGMENTGATVFSEAFVVDSIGYNDRNYLNVNAHELAHQWFGNLVTETSGDHHWLHEGFASFYALLAEKEIFGADYYYWKLLQSAERLQELSDAGKGESLLDPSASSLTFYEKGAWALHQLRSLIGERDFRSAVADFLESNRFGNVTTDDFLEAVKANTLVDITPWEAQWLKQTAFAAEEAFEVLNAQEGIRDYFAISALRPEPLRKKAGQLRTALLLPNDYSGQEAVYQLSGEDPALSLELYKIAFESENLMVRQAIALSLELVPPSLKNYYETLLEDPSYVTREAALYHLWINFPADRERYLDLTAREVGFQDKSLRQLWLVLALATGDFLPANSGEFIEELRAYTGIDYSFEIRQNALEYIHQLDSYDDRVYLNLVQACTHPNWRFRSAMRELLDQLLSDGGRRAIFARLRTNMDPASQAYLDRALSK
jgi:aminopeptidase N